MYPLVVYVMRNVVDPCAAPLKKQRQESDEYDVKNKDAKRKEEPL